MKWILWIALALFALVGVITIVGYLLPVSHEASRSADFNKPPEAVHALISDLKNYPQWWPENEVNVEVVENVPPTRFVTRIVGETAFGGTWTMEIVPISTGSRLTITERGEIYNPIFRTLAGSCLATHRRWKAVLAAASRQLSWVIRQEVPPGKKCRPGIERRVQKKGPGVFAPGPSVITSVALPASGDAEARHARRQDAADRVGVGGRLLAVLRRHGVGVGQVEHVERRDQRHRAEAERAVDAEVNRERVVVAHVAHRVEVHLGLAAAVGAVRRQDRLREREALAAQRSSPRG